MGDSTRARLAGAIRAANNGGGANADDRSPGAYVGGYGGGLAGTWGKAPTNRGVDAMRAGDGAGGATGGGPARYPSGYMMLGTCIVLSLPGGGDLGSQMVAHWPSGRPRHPATVELFCCSLSSCRNLPLCEIAALSVCVVQPPAPVAILYLEYLGFFIGFSYALCPTPSVRLHPSISPAASLHAHSPSLPGGRLAAPPHASMSGPRTFTLADLRTRETAHTCHRRLDAQLCPSP